MQEEELGQWKAPTSKLDDPEYFLNVSEHSRGRKMMTKGSQKSNSSKRSYGSPENNKGKSSMIDKEM